VPDFSQRTIVIIALRPTFAQRHKERCALPAAASLMWTYNFTSGESVKDPSSDGILLLSGGTVHQSLDALDRILNMASSDESIDHIEELRRRWKKSEKEQANWQEEVRQSMARWSLQRARVEVRLLTFPISSAASYSVTGWVKNERRTGHIVISC
jgi:hypothetical protein